MKKKLKVIIFGIAVISASVLMLNKDLFLNHKNSDVDNMNISSEKTSKKNDEGIVLELSMDFDCAYSNANAMYEAADAVFIGKYLSDEKVEMIPKARPYTTSLFEVQKVLKNAVDAKLEKEVFVRYGGGTVSLSEYMKGRDQVDYQKMGINNLSESQLKKSKVQFNSKNTNDSELSQNPVRVLFVNYEPEKNDFIAICDYNGMISYDNQSKKAFDTNSNSLKSYTFIK